MIQRAEGPEDAASRRRSPCPGEPSGESPDSSLAVVASVNDGALRAWAELWEGLKPGVTPAGFVLPQMQAGFKPSCGWADFLENLWLLKHYLDYTSRFCKGAQRASAGD